MSLPLHNPSELHKALLAHVGHDLEAVTYGPPDSGPVNAAIECLTCGEVLIDADDPAYAVRHAGEGATCGCGFSIVWTGEEWQHDAAPWRWGDDHQAMPA